MLEQIDHINIVVADLEAMTRFYRDRLGMKLTKQVTINGSWIDEVVGLSGVEADVVYLDPPGGPRVELIRYRAPKGATLNGTGGLANTQGIRHMAFRVDDIDATAEQLRRGGVALLGGVQQVPDAQVTYASGMRKRLIYFKDPEGNLLELCEYRAAPTTETLPVVADNAAVLAPAGSPRKILPPTRRRRAHAARRRLYMSLTALLLLVIATLYAMRVFPTPPAPPPAHVASTTTATAPVTDWTDPRNPNILALRDRYLSAEGAERRGLTFRSLAVSLQSVARKGGKIRQEDVLAVLGPPDMYRDLGPFRFFAYFYSSAPTTQNDVSVDVSFDKMGVLSDYRWRKSADVDRSAMSWKPFPTTQSTDPKVLMQLLPKQEAPIVIE